LQQQQSPYSGWRKNRAYGLVKHYTCSEEEEEEEDEEERLFIVHHASCFYNLYVAQNSLFYGTEY